MKTQIIENTNQDQVTKDFKNELARITKTGIVVHFATFYDRFSEKHKVLICYYD